LRHSFIDKYSHIKSPVHAFDARLKLTLVFLSILIIVSEPKGQLNNFIFYAPVVFTFMLLSRIPLNYFLKRLLIVTPFFGLAAAFYPLSHYISDMAFDNMTIYIAFSIFLKALLSVSLLLLLISSEKFHRLLAAMRKVGLPKIVAVVAALMYRYIFILHDETLRTTTARMSRTPGRLKQGRFKVLGNQLAMIFIRSWERSKNIYNAMISRGFNGNFSNKDDFRIQTFDIPAFLVLLSGFLCIRFSNYLYFYFF